MYKLIYIGNKNEQIVFEFTPGKTNKWCRQGSYKPSYIVHMLMIHTVATPRKRI